ncbi:CBS domain-containing protein [Natrononativus amylolyticus]|uniref:CBS domain-containing protein n=1 Tax=Natrononativus amylolyticus TaxID=2963434 RepID=UPI0020CEEC2C|nr:CBS domain-containing protein [Natrononativus amylolyticus]
MPVIDIARTRVVTVAPESPLSEVVETMRAESVGSAVVAEDGEPLGIVTDRDLAMVLLTDDPAPESQAVAELLADDLVTVTADTGIYEVVEELSRTGSQRIPVVDDDGSLVGIVSLSDVVVLLGMELQHVGNAIRTASPAYERLATDLYE